MEFGFQEDIDLAYPVNWDNALNKGLRHRWKAIPAWKGLKLRDMVRGNHGTLVGGAAYASPTGLRGQRSAIFFDGTDDSVSLLRGVVCPATGWTLNWYGNLVDTGSYEGVITNNLSHGVAHNQSSGLIFVTTDDTNNQAVLFSQAQTGPHAWGLAMNLAGTSLTVFRDGVQVGTVSFTATAFSWSGVTVNIGTCDIAPYKGLLSEISLHARPFTAKDFKAWHDAIRRADDPTLNYLPSTFRVVDFGIGGTPAAPATYTAAAALTGTASTLAASAQHVTPSYTAAVALAGGGTALAAAATFSPGTKTATAALSGGSSSLAASATFSPGTKTATAALSGGSTTLAASAVFATGAVFAAASLSGGSTALAASATFSPGTKTATGALVGGSSTIAAAATFSPGTHTATAALSGTKTTLAATATYSPGVHTASAGLIGAGSTIAASASFSPGTKTAAAALAAASGVLVAAATYSPGVHTAAASLSSGASTLVAAATYAPGTHTAVSALSGAGTALAASLTYRSLSRATVDLVASSAILEAHSSFGGIGRTGTMAAAGGGVFYEHGSLATILYEHRVVSFSIYEAGSEAEEIYP